MRITFDKFLGAIPRLAPDRLPDGASAFLRNVLPKNGAMQPFPGAAATGTTFDATTRTVFRYGADWFQWPVDVDAVEPPLPFDSYDRVYYTGDGYPKVTSQTLATAGVGNLPRDHVRIGLPQPAPPTLTLGASTGAAFTEDRVYRVTWVNQFGEEGPASLSSNVVTVEDGQTVDVTVTVPADDPVYKSSTWLGWRLYRSVVGGGYLYVDDVPITQTTYTDAARTDQLSEPLQTIDWFEPNDNLRGLKAHPAGFLCGFYDNVQCYSEIGAVHAWPPKYQQVIPEQIVANAIVEDAVIVLTTERPYIARGQLPESMGLAQLSRVLPCASKRSVVEFGSFCVYASFDGLVLADSAGRVDIISAALYTPEQWRAMDPSTMEAGRWQGLYVLAVRALDGTRKTIMIDPQAADAVYETSELADFFYSDVPAQKLYSIVAGGMNEWAAGSAQVAQWRSRLMRVPRSARLRWARVFADGYPLTVRVVDGDGRVVGERTIRSDKPTRLPLPRLYNLQVEIESSHTVYQVDLASSIQELR